jgi:hypothetical protein
MDITPYVDSLRRDLFAAADAAGGDARAVAERLSYALDPAARLALMEAVSQAAAEITAELPSGGVDVRLAGRDLEFAVHVTPEPIAMPSPQPEPEPLDEVEDEEDGTIARITLRIPEAVKARAEELAAKSGSSLNTWVVNVIRSATREGGIKVDVDLTSIHQMIQEAMGGIDSATGQRGKPGKRMSGWV